MSGEETIEVRYSELGSDDGLTYYHKYILYTDSSGVQYGMRAGPTNGSSSAQITALLSLDIFSDRQAIFDNWGNLAPNVEVYRPSSGIPGQTGYDPGFIDYDYSGTTPDLSEEIISGDDLSSVWSALVSEADNIANARYVYHPLWQNSNSFIDEVLRRADLSQPVLDQSEIIIGSIPGIGGYNIETPARAWAPGSGRRLQDPVFEDPGSTAFNPSSYSGGVGDVFQVPLIYGDADTLNIAYDNGDGTFSLVSYQYENGEVVSILRGLTDSSGNIIAVTGKELLFEKVEKDSNGIPQLDSLDWGSVVTGAGAALGSTLGRRLFGDDRLAGSLAGAALGQITSQLAAEVLVGLGNSSESAIRIGKREVTDIGVDIAGAAAGALTSYLVGEVFAELGIDGFAGEALQQVTSSTLSSIASNVIKDGLGQTVNWGGFFDNLGGSALNVVGSFLGSKLASFVTNFDSVGGQIGFSVGGSLGGIAAGLLFQGAGTVVANFLAPGVGVFVGSLLGGLIGSLFSGTPESGAHLAWNAAEGRFEIGATWSDDWGGSVANAAAEDRAENAAATAGDVLNRIVEGLGTTAANYANPDSPTIAQGAYGQRGEDWLYWGNGENSRTHPLSGTYDTPLEAINHGLEVALETVTVRGGDLYLKRALYHSIENAQASGELDFSQIIGDLSIGADLSFYEDNRALIDAAIALAPESALAQGWVLTLLRGAELDLDQYYKSDFYGGLGGFLDAHPIGEGEYATPSDFSLAYQYGGEQDGLLITRDGAGALPSGTPVLPGADDRSFSEARWRGVAGPHGKAVTAMETGQTADGATVGGGLRNSAAVTIDETRAYEYTVYVRKHDLSAHSLYFGANYNTVVNAVTGSAVSSPYFFGKSAAWQQANLDDDRWYKIVGTILPEGATASSHADHGGVYDTVTGEKIADTTTFAWDPARTTEEAKLRFFSYYDDNVASYSTYWYAPSIRVLDSNGAPGPNILSIEGWPSDPYGQLILPDFNSTFGYGYGNSVYSDIKITTGTGAVTLADNPAAPTVEGPGSGSLSRLNDDIYVGNNGNDVLRGYYGWDWLDGQAGHDSIYGGNGNDVLIGRDGNDRLYGENDDDRLDGGNGNDLIYGGNGDDIIYYSSGTNTFDGGAGIDTLSFEGLEEKLGGVGGYDLRVVLYNSPSQYSYLADDNLVGLENLTGSKFKDLLYGNNGVNVITGLAGDDLLHGFNGNDTLVGGSGADILNGEDNSDTASYRDAASGVSVSLRTGEASGGDAEGDTFISIENLEGSEFADILEGSTGTSTLTGLGGNDIFKATSGATAYKGGEGIDSVEFTGSTVAVSVNLANGTGSGGNATGDTFEGIEWLIGSDSNIGDVLSGTDGEERFQGGIGNDTLQGARGDDSYVLQRGGDQDYVTDIGGDRDYVVIDSAFSINEVLMHKSGSSLRIRGVGGGDDDSIYINSHFNTATPQNRLEYVYFENGSSINIFATVFSYGNSDDSSYLQSTSSTVSHFYNGRAGNDNVRTGWGNDILIGGSGNDTLAGGQGFDQYIFGRDSDLDIINDAGGVDTLVIAGDVSADELLFKKVGSHLYIGIRDLDNPALEANQVADRVQILNHYVSGNQLETLRVGLQNISIPAYMGQITGENNAPQGPPQNARYFVVKPPFYGGQVATLSGYDPDGDSLTYSIESVSGGGNAPTNFSIVNGNKLYTSEYWTQSDFVITTITIGVSDGQASTSYDLQIEWSYSDTGPKLPIILDLDGDGVELVDPAASSIIIDANEDGVLDQLGWAGPDDGFLAFDRDGSGTINSLSEISFVDDLEGATTDLEGLRAFDEDLDGISDGKLDANDVWFNEFYVWNDANQNAISEAGELVRLSESGITAIDLTGTPTGDTVDGASENVIVNTGTYIRADGSTGGFGDVALGVLYGTTSNQGQRSVLGGEATLSLSVGEDVPAHVTTSVLTNLFATKNGDDSGLLAGVAADATGGKATPIVFDLGWDGLEIVPIGRSPVLFDADNDGRKEWTGWFGPGDAALAIDTDNNGAITNGLELSFTRFVEGAQTDLEGLAGFDSNANGVIDAGDARWGELLLWRDANVDGVSQDGELLTLAEMGIVSIGLAGSGEPYKDGGNIIHQTAVFSREGREDALIGDVSLGYLELDNATLAELDPTFNNTIDLGDTGRPGFAENGNGRGTVSTEDIIELVRERGGDIGDQLASLRDHLQAGNGAVAAAPAAQDAGMERMRHQLVAALAQSSDSGMAMIDRNHGIGKGFGNDLLAMARQ